MKCKNCEKGILTYCPICNSEVVLCLEEEDLMSGEYWDIDSGCDGIGDGEEDDSY